MPNPEEPCTDRDLAWTLTTLLRAYVSGADHALANLPGGVRAFRLLATLAGPPLPNQLALAEASGLDRTAVTYLLDDLERAGLVRRCSDPADRRARRVVLTDTGAERAAGLRAHLAAVETAVLGADAQLLRSLLQRAAVGVRDIDRTTCPHVEALGRD